MAKILDLGRVLYEMLASVPHGECGEPRVLADRGVVDRLTDPTPRGA